MIVGREHLIYFEKLEAQQKRIFPDACDYGLWVNSEEFKNNVRERCRELNKDFKSKSDKWEFGASWSCKIPYEMEDGNWSGVKLTVSLNKTRRGKEFFTIDINRAIWEENPFRGE
jgi:hypothetical protein